ncbi:MAG: cytochrome b/b6 domain-containing protein [Pseudomonas sp.]
MNDSKERYGGITRLFHWGMALLIVWQFMKFFDRISDGEHWIGENLASWHISIGSVLLVLILLRIIWAVSQKNNRPEQDPATALLVKAGHGLLYLAMLLLPVTGALYMVGNGYGLKPFGIELIAGGGDKVDWMIGLGGLHSPLAWALLILVIGHAGMALLHHFVKKDGVLGRML